MFCLIRVLFAERSGAVSLVVNLCGAKRSIFRIFNEFLVFLGIFMDFYSFMVIEDFYRIIVLENKCTPVG